MCPFYNKYCPHEDVYIDGKCCIQSGDNDVTHMKQCAMFDPKHFKSQDRKNLARKRRDEQTRV